LAAVFAPAACFVLAVVFLYLSARRAFNSPAAGWTAALVFALNPNMLYLQSTAMTEAVFAACLCGLLWVSTLYEHSPAWSGVVWMAAALNAAALTRYEGWFLIPFVTLFVLRRNGKHALVLGALASLAPLAWLAHNQFYYSNALEFYNGPYSAMAIAREGLEHGGVQRYPGNGNWREAVQYFFAAARLTEGGAALLLAGWGVLVLLVRRAWWPLLLLALPPVFYVVSIHSASTPIYVPGLWPFSWYNTRYGLSALPLVAFAVAALSSSGVALPAPRIRAVLLCALVTIPWFFGVVPCWRESQVNSVARRAWTSQAAQYLAAQYEGGSFIYTFGDLSGIFRRAGIGLKAGTHQDNHPLWDAAVQRPGLFLTHNWVIAVAGDKLSTAARSLPARYQLVRRVMVEGAPPVEIYRHR
jgi:4-amino-4-deoxy-L-arabinose transferase-like glycosyltransferase